VCSPLMLFPGGRGSSEPSGSCWRHCVGAEWSFGSGTGTRTNQKVFWGLNSIIECRCYGSAGVWWTPASPFALPPSLCELRGIRRATGDRSIRCYGSAGTWWTRWGVRHWCNSVKGTAGLPPKVLMLFLWDAPASGYAYDDFFWSSRPGACSLFSIIEAKRGIFVGIGQLP
jgi:hypothetical protein